MFSILRRNDAGLPGNLMIISGIIALLFFSCSGPEVNTDHSITVKDSPQGSARENLKKPVSSYPDTIFISGNSAVFYTPDSLQLISIKTINKKEIYESLMHDCYFQMRNARLVIQRNRPKVKIIEVSKARWLAFVMTDKTMQLIDLNMINDICGIYLFDGKQKPERIDMMNVDTDLGFYFHQ